MDSPSRALKAAHRQLGGRTARSARRKSGAPKAKCLFFMVFYGFDLAQQVT
jgi:hypothetical protein